MGILMSRFRLERLAILHADTQGHELNVLTGAESTLVDIKIDCIFLFTRSNEQHPKVPFTTHRAPACHSVAHRFAGDLFARRAYRHAAGRTRRSGSLCALAQELTYRGEIVDGFAGSPDQEENCTN